MWVCVFYLGGGEGVHTHILLRACFGGAKMILCVCVCVCVCVRTSKVFICTCVE